MAKWKICPNCEKLHSLQSTTCENCGHELVPLVAKPRPSVPVPKKPRKPVQYVRLSHGRIMKKSTYDWIERKNSGAMTFVWLFFGISLFIAMVKGCS